jgi:hypothetical protein
VYFTDLIPQNPGIQPFEEYLKADDKLPGLYSLFLFQLRVRME